MRHGKEINTDPAHDAAAMDRLRDRTDELELIISSLTIFALLSLPSWLFSKIASVYMHLSTSMVITANVAGPLLAGVSYVLAACFIVHLIARAYWVGLIGLRAAFPDGINWNKTPGIGPVSRKYYRQTLPDIDTVIQNTDKLASSLFAVISLLTLSVLWFGVIMVTALVIAGAIGSQLGVTNAALGFGSLVLLVLFVVGPLLVYVLDAQLAARFPSLANKKFYAGLISFLRRVAELAYPQRLVLPVQLTLQSNTRPFLVFSAIVLGIVAIIFIGNTNARAWRNFTLSDEFKYLDSEQVQGGFRSTYYEDMASPMDQLRAWPRVDSFTQSSAFVQLFLPYQPLRDNLLIDEFCADTSEPENRSECLRMLWRVSINGADVQLSNFTVAERADLRMRGLLGLIPMAGLQPGMHEIEVEFNPLAEEDAAPIDDRYSQSSVSYSIPIAFVPAYELPVQPAPATPPHVEREEEAALVESTEAVENN